MKFRPEHFTIHHYIRYMRRQGKHVQHVHAAIFAGTVTALIAGIILYADYGFWRQRYERKTETPVEEVSTRESFGSFLEEAKDKFNAIGSAGAGLLEGKETFSR